MARPRKQLSGLPSYCYRDRRNGAYFMLVPGPEGKLTRRTYGTDLHRMLDDWARTWGATVAQGDTVAAALDVYLGVLAQRRHRGEITETTEKDYRKHAAKLRAVFGHIALGDIDVPMLVRWRDVRGQQSQVQFNRERTVLLEVFRTAVERGMVANNPVSMLGRMKERPRDRYATDDDVAEVLKRAGREVQAATLLAMATGLRQGDILTLKRADFGPNGLSVSPSKMRSRTRKGLHFPWSAGMRAACELAHGKLASIGGYWLCNQSGKPYTSDGFRSLWHKALSAAVEEAGIERFTFNDLRAKAGTEAEDWRILGHLDQRTFSRVYDRKPTVVKPAR
jgi:integrase